MSAANNEINTYFGRCRCCLNYGYLKNMWEEHYWEGEKEIYVEMLVQCFALSWEHCDDSMEHDQICEACIKRLRDACEFKKVILESQEELLGQIGASKQDEIVEPPTPCNHVEIVDQPTTPTQVESMEQQTNSEISVKTEREVEEMLTVTTESEGMMYVDDPDDPDYVDPDDQGDPNTRETEYEDVEYLEDDVMSLAGLDNTETVRKRQKLDTENASKSKWPKKLPKSLRYKTYKQYTEEELRRCIESVRNGELTYQEASVKYKIPQKTVIARSKLTPTDLLIDNTTNKHNTTSIKTRLRKKPTIFRQNPLKVKIIKKIAAKVKSETTVAKEEVNTEQEVNNIAIKTEENDEKKDLVKAEDIRTKYKAIVNAKFKKETSESDKSHSEMIKHKDNIKHILECSNATLIKGFWGNGYSCCFCDIHKENPTELKAHNLEIHKNVADNAIKVKYVSDLVLRLDITYLKCELCQKEIDSLEILIEHLIEKHSKNIHKDIKNYIIPFKFDTEPLKCVKCNKEYKYFKLLSEHMSEHYRNYECPVCERSFINRQSMQTHSYRHKSGVFKCSHCPKVFDTRPKRSVHERVTHALSNKTRKCRYCDERFSTKDLVLNHESKIHGATIPVFNCQACDKSYNSQSSLITHRKRYHLMLRPHKCSFCEMAFFSKIELRSHTVTHTKSREFKCDICNKCFGTRTSLSQHVRGHLDDRRFKCGHCERSFVHRTAFKVHMRSKHGEIV